MAISIGRYVNIVSGVGAGAAVAQRELIGRLFNDNPLIPVNAILEFTSAANVGAYFGLNSPEYLRAVFYFGFVSKLISKAKKLSFARYAKATAPARVYGGVVPSTLAQLTAINAGSLNLTIGGQVAALAAIDLTGAASFAAVAAILQAAFRAQAGSQYAAATVVYDGVGQKFNFAASTAGAAAIVAPTGTLAPLIGWQAADTVLSPGTNVQTIDGALQASADISTNFGSFAFIMTLVSDEVVTAAQWTNDQNVSFMFCAPYVVLADGQTLYAAISGLEGTALGFAPTAGQYDEMCPMILEAATDYTRRNSTQNYMFNRFNLTPKVVTDGQADAHDAIRGNYYGVTQTAGQQVAFYQRGLLTGGETAPSDQNVYANECWFKDRAQSSLLQALLSLPKIPANAAGRSQILAILQGPIQEALFNGTISVGKNLTIIQQLAVTDFTGDDKAWYQVQAIGYWVDVVIAPVVNPQNGTTQYEANYTVVYSKDDTVRKVNGTHILI